jgi:uncharacterized 2Fe-2S/4Fe-4S cluster protein (DUF4445 family)
MKHYLVIFKPDGQKVFIHGGATIFEAAGQAGIILNSVCGGKGTCGKCIVNLESEDREVLACEYKVDRDVIVTVPQTSRLFPQQILAEGVSKKIELSSMIRKQFLPGQAENTADFVVALNRDEISHIHDLNKEATSQFESVCKHGNVTAVLRRLPKCENAEETTTCWEPIAVEPGDTTKNMFGVAVDIGTTTVVAKLIDMSNGLRMATVAQSNPQIQYGDDVISRISYAESETGHNALHKTIVECVDSLTARLCEKSQVSRENVYELVAAGNTTMNHLFLGFPVKQLGQAPYKAYSVDAHDRNAAELGITISSCANVHTISNIAGFVGSDTVAVGLAVGMDSMEKMTLTIDIGTNGELILGTKNKMYAASCAAGPALEGARISRGSRAMPGAIERVVLTDGDIDLDVIGACPAQSICGSGLVDAVAVLLDFGVIDQTGRFVERDQLEGKVPDAVLSRLLEQAGKPEFVLAWDKDKPAVTLTQKDIRETQLAKAAIRVGIRLLQKKMGLEDSDIEQILLAGAFGNYIQRESARRIGLLPNIELEKIHFVGNAASVGAEMVLLSGKCRKMAAELARKIEYVEIAHESEFQMVFADSLLF